MQVITGGVTAAKGFAAASCAAGIKKAEKRDMALLFSEVPCAAAGTFTTNLVQAAPVLWDSAIVRKKKTAQAVVINSGIANACTGQEGMDLCAQSAQATADALQIDREQVLVASTGVIGQQIPLEKIKIGIRTMAPLLQDTETSASQAAEAILTTDTKKKEAAVQIALQGKTVTIGGMCKGSGMIHPNMCTMLSFLTTDLAITQELLQEALSTVVQDTYNMISIDGDTSTNDTVLLLANGLAGNPLITEKGADYETVVEALFTLNEFLAKQIAADGEGATKLFEAVVEGAATKEQARILAKSIITSNLSKAAMFGADANWGRILCAMGYAGADFDVNRVGLWFESTAGRIEILRNSQAQPYAEEEATKILSAPEVRALVQLQEGSERAMAWGCDLTYDYVKINADYRT